MPNLAQLVSNKATATVDFGDAGVLHLEYFPQRLTAQMLLTLANADPGKLAGLSEDQQLATLAAPADILSALLASWDLTETDASGNEVPFPLDRAHIEALGITVQWQILGAVVSAQGKAAAGEALAPTA